MKTIYTEILHKDKKETLIKSLAAIFKMKNTFLIDEELIKICYDSRVNEYLEVKCIKDFVWRRYNIDNLYN